MYISGMSKEIMKRRVTPPMAKAVYYLRQTKIAQTIVQR
jgi:hypothetical protein